MTRSEAYAEGFQDGRRWAELDLSNGMGLYAHSDALMRATLESARGYKEDATAHALGSLRGYRDTVARYEAGTLTRQMFEHAPRGGTRA